MRKKMYSTIIKAAQREILYGRKRLGLSTSNVPQQILKIADKEGECIKNDVTIRKCIDGGGQDKIIDQTEKSSAQHPKNISSTI